MPAAIAIPAIIGAAGVGASVYGANKASNAAQSAASQQQASVNRAQDFAQQAWQQQQQALSPYRQAGQNALNQLMARQYGPGGTAGMNAGQIGLQNAPGWQGGGFSLASLRPGGGGMPGGPQGQMPFNQQPQGMPQGGPQMMQQPQMQGQNAQGFGTAAQGILGALPQIQQAIQQQQGGGGMQQPMGQGPQIPQGGMVSVTDDSGETRQVPAAQASLYQQRGFTVKAV